MDVQLFNLFSCNELCQLFGGKAIEWTKEFLLENITFTQGYTQADPYIQQFVEVIVEFSPKDKERLLMFITGERRMKVIAFAIWLGVILYIGT